MKTRPHFLVPIALALTTVFLTGGVSGLIAADKPDSAKIERLTGLKGAFNEQENVFKVSAPRADVNVAVDKWAMPSFMGLTSWAAFMPGKTAEAMVMGDLVLFQDEANPVMSAALDAGLEVTALHNHFFFDEPKVYFMHIGGTGDPEKLAAGVKAVWGAIKNVRAENPKPATRFAGEVPTAGHLDAAAIEKALGQKSESQDGVFKAVFGRQAKMECGCDLGKEMGV